MKPSTAPNPDASYPPDLCYADELRRYARENGLRYFPTISRAKEAPEWRGDVGRAEDYFLPARLEARDADLPHVPKRKPTPTQGKLTV